MKQLCSLILLVIFFLPAIAQVAITTDGSAPNASSMLDIKSADKGLLIPRMTTLLRTGIAVNATTDGLTVYDTDTKTFWYYNAASWVEIPVTISNYWTQNGSSIYNNNTGNIGIGTTTPDSKLQITDGTGTFTSGASVRIGKNLANGDAKLIKFGDGNFTYIGENVTDDLLELRAGKFYFNNGNVGIGLNSPSSPLSFAQVLGDKINLWNTDATHNYGFGVQAGLLQIHSNDATADIAFGSGNSLSMIENMRIKGNGNVGIGTNNPLDKLSILTADNSTGFSHSNGSISIASFLGNPSSGANGAWITTRGVNAPLYFATSGSSNPAMTITPLGNIGIGTTLPATARKMEISSSGNTRLRLSTTQALGAAMGFEMSYPGNTYSDWRIGASADVVNHSDVIIESSTDHFISNRFVHYEFDVSSFSPDDNTKSLGLSGFRWTTIYATNGTINTSDRRDKKNIADLNYGLKEVMQLRPVTFNWINNAQPLKKIGFIAQEVEPIIEEVVDKPKKYIGKDGNENEGRYGMYYTDLIPVLTKAIQEQQQIITEQKKQLEDFEKRLKALENK